MESLSINRAYTVEIDRILQENELISTYPLSFPFAVACNLCLARDLCVVPTTHKVAIIVPNSVLHWMS